jgi:hypothetical protein
LSADGKRTCSINNPRVARTVCIPSIPGSDIYGFFALYPSQ